ncbi:MAG TPA: BON domain-containing protein [Pyrinomonadaceae bacterium]|jgi:osmotically-inducible protein OsmY|nr:BON domain-containing protein [Pyrinomonadaceae bacterium]
MKKDLGRRILISFACLSLAVFAFACKKSFDDAAITTGVKAKILADSPALAAAVSVTTAEGVVTLTGAVDSAAVKAKVEADAKGVEGVKSVVNNLTVKPPIVFSEDPTIKNAVLANLTKAKITGITVDVVNGEVTLKGTIARAQLQAAMQAANDAKPKKVNNQMTIK